jgi:hypothetical protein
MTDILISNVLIQVEYAYPNSIEITNSMIMVELAEPAPPVISLDAGAISISGPQLDIVPGAVSILFSAGGISISGPQFDIVPGVVTILLDAATLTALGPRLVITVGDAPNNTGIGYRIARGGIGMTGIGIQ